MCTLLKFIFLGPFILIGSVFADCYIYYYNLFVNPEEPPVLDKTDLTVEAIGDFVTVIDAVLKEKRHGEDKTGSMVD